ncbi:DUF6134 family protein [uncultured Tistrella sp.]|uniref:DUF6134 family protein n=1 Tax=Tistrella mobilis TaxID=171437 RepID=UPI002626A4FE|nr:DUF6134 family protein [uncultured Tistrella sp.]
MAGLLGGGLLLAAPVFAGRALAAAAPGTGELAFDVFRGDAPMGRHVLRFTPEADGRLTVSVEIDLAVSFGPITVYRYTHRNTESWAGGRLVAIRTCTDDDGTAYAVDGRAEGDSFVVEGADGRVEAPADVIPTSYWHPETPARLRWLDTQRGRLLGVAVTDRGTVERPAPDGGSIAARAYDVTGDLTMTLWYRAAEPRWLGVAFDGRGREVRYRLARDTAPSPLRLARGDWQIPAAGA